MERMSEKRDYYEVLGVSRDATHDQIKSAYRRLARKLHPDVNPGDDTAEARFKEINEAYGVLSDPEKRQRYDQYGPDGVENGMPDFGGFGDLGGFGDIFDMFFGGGGAAGTRGRSTAERGNDLRYDIEMTLEEAAHGVERTIRVTRMESCDICGGSGAQPGSQPVTCPTCQGAGQVRQQVQTFFGTQIHVSACPRCNGQGRVIGNPCSNCSGQGRIRKTADKSIKIPAGVDTGMKIRMAGEGDVGLRGGPNGDLYIVTHVKKHDFFQRKDNDLWCEVSIGVSLAALGGSIEVKTIDGTEHLDIAAGTQSGEVYSLRGKGMPDPARRTAQGDQNVVVKVMTPTHLTDEQKDLLRKFAEMRGEEVNEPRGKSVFQRVKDAFSGLGVL